MKRKLSILYSILLSVSSIAMADVRDMDPGDPNLDIRWEWKSDGYHNVYSSISGESPASEHSVRLPFFTAGNPLNSFPYDYDSEDGWVLVHRDFGIQERGQPFPFFTMYNRYRGTFRIMVYNALARDQSFYTGKIRFLDSRDEQWQATSLLDFQAKTKCFISDFDKNIEISALNYMKTCGDWAIFDFPLIGFDPSLSKSDPILCFSLSGVDSQHLDSSGNASIDLVQEIEKKVVRPGFGISDIKQAADVGLSYYRAPANWMEELTNPKNKGQSWYNSAVNLSRTAVVSYAPWIGALTGVVESFIGGSKKAAQWEPLRFKGQMKFDFQGQLVLERGLWAHNFFLKTGPPSAMGQRPLRDVPWGVFNLQSAPVLLEEAQDMPPGIKWYWYRLVSGGEVVVNPEAGLDLTSTEVALRFDRKWLEFPPVHIPGVPDPFQGLDPESDTTPFEPMENFTHRGIVRLWYPAKPVAVLYKLTFKTRQPTLHSDDEIVMIKTVAVESPVEKREWRPRPVQGQPSH